MDEKVINDLSEKISEYDYEITIYRKRWYLHLVFVLLSVVFGFMRAGVNCIAATLFAVIIFMIRINKKRKLSFQKSKLTEELTQSLDKISMEKYLELKQELVNAGRS